MDFLKLEWFLIYMKSSWCEKRELEDDWNRWMLKANKLIVKNWYMINCNECFIGRKKAEKQEKLLNVDICSFDSEP